MERFHDSICFRKDELDAPKIPQNILEPKIEVNPLLH